MIIDVECTLCTNWYLCEPRNTIDTNGQQMASWLWTRHSPRWASLLPRAFTVQPMKEKCQIWLKSLACSSVPENISVLHTWEGIWCPHTLWLVCFSSSSCSILCWKLDTKEARFHTETRKSREINQFSKVLFLLCCRRTAVASLCTGGEWVSGASGARRELNWA